MHSTAESADSADGGAADGNPEDDELQWEWTRQMAGSGFRHTGSPTHRGYIDTVERQLEALGLAVTRYPTPLDYWAATAWSLRVTDAQGVRHDVPVAWYRPYSGETPPAGVTATVADLGPADAAAYAGRPVRGAIVLADAPVDRLSLGDLDPLTVYAHPPAGMRAAAGDDYARIGRPRAPSLDLARRHGAIGMVNILDLSPELARGQFSPHQQVFGDLPTLHVDRVQGARLRDLLRRGPLTATLTLVATRARTTVDYLVAELPGSGARAGSVLLLTHTDGQNAVEESGVPAVLAMARRLTRTSQARRPRDVLFLLSGVHMASHEAAVHTDVFLREHPQISERVVAALAPEHLGATEWTDDPVTGLHRPTGRPEFAAVPVGNSDTLTRLAVAELAASDLTRTAVLVPFEGGLYGEGTGPYKVGIPTIGFITGPTYLLQVEPGGGLDKLDAALMRRQTAFLTRLLARLMDLPDPRPDPRPDPGP